MDKYFYKKENYLRRLADQMEHDEVLVICGAISSCRSSSNILFQALPEWEHNLLYEALLPFFSVFFQNYYHEAELRAYWHGKTIVRPKSDPVEYIDPIEVIKVRAFIIEQINHHHLEYTLT